MMPTTDTAQTITPVIILKVTIDGVAKKVTIPLGQATIENWVTDAVIYD